MSSSRREATARKARQNRYNQVLDKIFFDRFKPGSESVDFERDHLIEAAATLGIKLPKNLGDIIYSPRFRTPLSDDVLATQPEGMEWRIELAGRSRYRFVLGRQNRIRPNPSLIRTKLPDATPELIARYALDDEQALLAIVRYNRLIDIFLGITTCSLQNHLRTTVRGIGQIEIDEVYVGVDAAGGHYVVPVQAKGGRDQVSVVQTAQDIKACEEKFPGIACRPVSVQFMAEKVIAMFELTFQDDELRVLQERHYLLVPQDELDPSQVRAAGLRVARPPGS
jgi:hypothetical protein